MTDRTLERIVSRTRTRHGSSRSDAYRWLYKRHGKLSATFAAFPPEWPDVAATMAAKGITGGRGRPLTGEAVRRIWERVCRDIGTAAVVQGTGIKPRAPNRARAPANWQPMPLPTPSVSPPPPPAEEQVERPGLLTRIGRSLVDRSTRPVEKPAEAVPTADPAALDLPREGGPLNPEQVRAMMADLRRTLDERSGR